MIRELRTSFLTNLGCAVAALLLITSACAARAAAQESSDAAIEQYGAAVDAQNKAVAEPETADINYELAVDEWNVFLKKFPDDPLASKAQFYLGVCQSQLGEFKGAITAFEAVVAKYPKFEMMPTAYYNLGIARMEQGRKANDKALLAKSQEAFATVVKDHAKSSQAANAQFFEGEVLYELDKKKEAAAAYQAALKLFGPKAKRRPTVLYNLGFVQEELGDTAGADKTYDMFLTENGQTKPPHPLLNEVYLRKGEVLIARNKFADADPWLAAAARAKGFKKADLATVQQAFCKFKLKKYADAGALYAKVVTGWPKSEYAKSSKLDAGTSFYWSGQYDDARKWLEQAVAQGGELANEGTRWIARSYLKQNKPAEALAAIDKILPKAKASKQLPDLLMARADALYEIPDKRAQSIAAYAKVANEHAATDVAPRAMYLAAFVAQEQGKYPQGLKYADEFTAKFAGKKAAKQYVDDVKYIAAGCNLLLSKYGPAEKLYRELLTEFPKDKNADRWQVQIGLCQFLAKNYDAAAKHFAPIAAGLKDAKLKAEANHLLGASQFELGKYKPARTALEAAIAADAKWRDADKTLLLLSHAQQRLGDSKAASASAARMLSEFPNSKVLDEAHYRLGDYAYDAQNYKKAAAEYQTVVDKYPKSTFAPYALYGLGWTQVKQNKFAEADKTLTSLIEKHKGHKVASESLMARAAAREKLKSYAPAIVDIDAFLATKPTGRDRLDALMIKARCQSRSGNAAGAVASFEAVVADAATDFPKDETLYELAWALREAKQDDKSVAAFERLAKEYPDGAYSAEALHHVGQHYYAKKNYKKAALSYYAAMNKAKDKALKEKAAHKLAWAYYMQDDFKNAEQTFAFQLTSSPSGSLVADAQYMLGESRFKQGGEKMAESLASYKKALPLEPSTKTLKVLALLHAGQAAASLKEWDESLQYLTKLTTDHPDSELVPEALYEQAWATQNKDDIDGALALYEKVLESASRTLVGARARFMVGEIHFAKKDHKEAMKNFGRVAFLYKNAPPEFNIWKANSLFEYARCLEALKKAGSAKKYYTQLIDEYPKSDKVALAKQRLEALGG